MLGSTDIKISDNFFLSLNFSELARISSLLGGLIGGLNRHRKADLRSGRADFLPA